jgi:hypothetical protein
MPLLHIIALAGAMAALEVPHWLREPDYEIAKDGDLWVLRKPGRGSRPPLAISRHPDRKAAEMRRRVLPRLRLGGLFVRYDPATQARTVIADWTGLADSREIESDVREILNRFAPAGPPALLPSTPLYLARLFGATGHTAEESTDRTRVAIHLDPFRATGRLHAAATILHELTHVERFRARGFHANRAAATLTKQDFVLLGLADEFAAYQAEADLVRSFLGGQPDREASRTAARAMRDPELRWPLALRVLLGFEGPADQDRRMREARRQVVLDLEGIAGRYWQSRHTDPLDPALGRRISDWRLRSSDWEEIATQRPAWKTAGAQLGPSSLQ